MDKFDIFFFENHCQKGRCTIEKDGMKVYMYENTDSYIESFVPAFPVMECLEKKYYVDTLTLKSEGHFLKHGSTRIGVWKEYDRTGELIQETDYETGFNISWEKLQPILIENKINQNDFLWIGREFVTIDEDSNVPRWYVILEHYFQRITYVFDGNTGEKISEKNEGIR